MTETEAYHATFYKFEQFQVKQIQPEFRVNFLGGLVRKSFYSWDDSFIYPVIGIPMTANLPVGTRVPYPNVGEGYIEWIDLLESVIAAHQAFTMIELGAGFGRGLVNAALAAKKYHGDIPLRLIGVEAEPAHFQWMKQHFQDNGLNPEDYHLIEAAVSDQESEVLFYVGKSNEWYGQSIASPDCLFQEQVQTVKAVSLSQLLDTVDWVDLLDIDVQGVELAVLSSAITNLNQKVKKIHIGTHGREIELGLRQLFRAHGWYKVNDFACHTTEMTEWGEIGFCDGIQTWINPRLSPILPTPEELQRLQETMKVMESKLKFQLEVERLQPELQQTQAQLQQIQAQLQNTQAQLQDSQQQLQTTQTQLQQTQTGLGQAQEIIQAMESSKFWQLRRQWITLKQQLKKLLGSSND